MIRYTIEKKRGLTTWIKVTEKNAKNETLTIQLSECTNPGGKNSLPYLWYKSGFMNRVLDTYLSVDTYCRDSEGNCYGRYNPQTKLSDDKKRLVINFNWMFENTEENKQKLINEVIRLFESAQGKSATQEKMEKIEEYAKTHGLEIVTEKPEGWWEKTGVCCPRGSVIITNRKSFRDKNCREALLVC